MYRSMIAFTLFAIYSIIASPVFCENDSENLITSVVGSPETSDTDVQAIANQGDSDSAPSSATVCVEISPSNPHEQPYYMCKGDERQRQSSYHAKNSYYSAKDQPSYGKSNQHSEKSYNRNSAYGSEYQGPFPPKEAYGSQPAYKPSYGGPTYGHRNTDPYSSGKLYSGLIHESGSGYPKTYGNSYSTPNYSGYSSSNSYFPSYGSSSSFSSYQAPKSYGYPSYSPKPTAVPIYPPEPIHHKIPNYTAPPNPYGPASHYQSLPSYTPANHSPEKQSSAAIYDSAYITPQYPSAPHYSTPTAVQTYSYPVPAPQPQCGQNILFNCVPTLSTVPCASSVPGYGTHQTVGPSYAAPSHVPASQPHQSSVGPYQPSAVPVLQPSYPSPTATPAYSKSPSYDNQPTAPSHPAPLSPVHPSPAYPPANPSYSPAPHSTQGPYGPSAPAYNTNAPAYPATSYHHHPAPEYHDINAPAYGPANQYPSGPYQPYPQHYPSGRSQPEESEKPEEHHDIGQSAPTEANTNQTKTSEDSSKQGNDSKQKQKDNLIQPKNTSVQTNVGQQPSEAEKKSQEDANRKKHETMMRMAEIARMIGNNPGKSNDERREQPQGNAQQSPGANAELNNANMPRPIYPNSPQWM